MAVALTATACAGSQVPVTSSERDGGEAMGSSASPSDDPGLAQALEDAVSGVEDEALQALLREHWSTTLERSPAFATALGVHRWDDRLGDPSLEAEAKARASRELWSAKAKALAAKEMSAADALTLRIFQEELAQAARREVCAFSTWSVSARENPMGTLNRLARLHRIESERDGENYLARVSAVAEHFDAGVARLRVGLEAGRVANAEALRRLVELLRRQLEADTGTWAVMDVDLPGAWGAEAQADFRGQLADRIDDTLRPAAKRYADFIEAELLPVARDDAHAGLVALPEGEACYEALIWQYTTLPMDAREVHELGLAEMARINDEMQTLGQRLFGTRDLAQILERLRTDPELHFSTEAEVEDFARAALADAKAAMPKAFGRLPRADCVVTPIPDYEAPFTTIAYYDEPHADGSKPGEYYVNTYAPKTRPRYEARVLAYHESIPGHHLQIAIAQELPALPAFRRYGGRTVFVEGWGLYSERLSDELGLYPEDLDRMGVLSFDAWRAGRLVVDTGIHALGWSRQQAVEYLVAHTALAENNIDNEVDRYITTPGQALAYKVGQLEFLALRERAEAALGEAFRLSDFHDLVLGGGALSIPLLRERVDAWLNQGR